MTERVRATAVGAALVPLALAVHAADPVDGLGIPCPFRAVTGLLCPGCGSGRALHHLLHGDVGIAHGLNPLVPPAVAVLGALYVGWLLRAWLPDLPIPRLHPPAWVGAACAFLVVGFAVARNTPAGAWLSPLA